MGLSIRLQDETGDVIGEVHDPKDLLGPRLPLVDDQSYHCLRFIDRYGDTYFNRLQMRTFLVEWDRLGAGVEGKESKELFMRVKELAKQCQQEPHLYLKFEGD